MTEPPPAPSRPSMPLSRFLRVLGASEDPGSPAASTPTPGPPWERPGAGAREFLTTAAGILFNPLRFFRELGSAEVFGRPLVFLALCLALVAIVQAVWYLMTLLGVSSPAQVNIRTTAATYGWAWVVQMVLVTSVAVLLYGFLPIVGVPAASFLRTFRTTAYVFGACALYGLVPCVGLVLVPLATLLILGVALTSAHGATTAQAIAGMAIVVVVAAAFLIYLAFLVPPR